MTYAVAEIAGRQYLVEPGKELLVNRLETDKKFDCDRVLMLVDGDTVSIGTPFLKEKLTFGVLGEEKADKIRVAKFHAKANYRRVTGSRARLTRIVLTQTAKSVKK